jgi:hypothetical protein
LPGTHSLVSRSDSAKPGTEGRCPKRPDLDPLDLIYEPVFGMGFRQFLLDNVQGEWSLVTMAWNMKRMYALAAA